MALLKCHQKKKPSNTSQNNVTELQNNYKQQRGTRLLHMTWYKNKHAVTFWLKKKKKREEKATETASKAKSE